MKRVQAQITVYAALSLGLILSLVCTCIKSVKQVIADTEINMSSRLSTEAVFAGYNNNLLSEFGIFAISDEQCCDAKLEYYAKTNIEGASVRNMLEHRKSWVSDKEYMTDNGGVGFERQVSEYMKAGGYAQIIKEFINVSSETEKSDKISEITEQIESVDEQVFKLDETDKKLIRTVNSVNDESLESLISDICEDIEVYTEYVNVKDQYGMSYCEGIYENNKNALISRLEDTKNKFNDACMLIDEYVETEKEADERIDACRDSIAAAKAQLGDIAGVLKNDIDDISVSKDTDREKLCNKGRIRPILEKNIEYCDMIIERLNGTQMLSERNYKNLQEQYQNINIMCRDIDISGLTAECKNVDIESESTGASSLKQLKDTLQNGISEIVLGGMQLSDGSFSYDGLATQYLKEGSDSGKQNVSDMALFNAYVLDKFPSYTDCTGEDGSAEWSDMSYAVEYIIAGKDSDRSNINEVILKLSVLREPTNFAHVISDSSKRNESLALATTLVGASGNAAAVKAAQYVIMGVWSYGESVMDVRRLFNGEELSLVKDSSDWRLSLENLLAMNFGVDKGKDETLPKKDEGVFDGKMSYEDYLGTLLAALDSLTKNYRTMQAIELRLIKLGETDFRMKRYAYSAVCNVQAVIQEGERVITREQKYDYAC